MGGWGVFVFMCCVCVRVQRMFVRACVCCLATDGGKFTALERRGKSMDAASSPFTRDASRVESVLRSLGAASRGGMRHFRHIARDHTVWTKAQLQMALG